MRITDFDRIVCVTVDTRFPAWPLRARRQVEAKGGECQLFVNGSARVDEIGRAHYGQVHGAVPAGFPGAPGAYHLARAAIEVVRRAEADGVETLLLVEDDLEITPDYERVTGAIRVPDGWGMYYFGANHHFHDTEEVAGQPHLLRLRGSYTSHCVGLHRRAFAAVAASGPAAPIDVLLGRVHEALPCYAAWPSVAIQVPAESSIQGGHADYRGWFASKGRNWPAPTPGLDRDLRLAKLRRDCPHGTRPPGCGCSDRLACSRTGREMGRQECYACLEPPGPATADAGR